MYIKEIRLNGFKSFADKSVISLGKNFTGIVGPNGSGKSNIVDAIKWVLGEQSVKTLRGTNNMTDVIFNGSKSRAASSSASVTLVFDNCDHTINIDYDEVSIKRIVYKSGDNEYYINNEKCRLKDIITLLIDTLASKESFNIIPQNKIDEILSDKPEERRTIFEDAAGVLKYRKRKEETLRKLERTQENIERIEMIIKELEISLLPLQKQSVKAIEAKTLRSELVSIEGGLITYDIKKYKSLIDENAFKKEEISNNISSFNSLSSSNDAKIEKNKLNLIKIEEKISLLQAKILDLTEELTKLTTKKELIKERSKYDKNSNEVKNNLIILKEKELNIKTDISKCEMDIKEFDEEIKKIEKSITEISLELSNNSKKRNILNEEINGLKVHDLETKSKISILKNNIENNSKVPYSVKAILNSNKIPGIIDTIGNILSIEEEYNLMLEVALGASANFVITENEDSAKQSITYLKDNKKGRVTFFPLTVIKPRSIEPEVKELLINQKGYLGIASDLVDYDRRYYNIVTNQLGNIIVCTDINAASNISKIVKYRYRIVTLTGELFHVGGSLTGGSINTYSGNKDKLDLETQEALLIKINNNIVSKTKELKSIDYNIEVIKNNVYKYNLNLVAEKEKLNIRNNLLSEYTMTHMKIKEEIDSLKGEKLEQNLKDILNLVNNLELEKELKEKELKSLQKEKSELNDQIIEDESLSKKNHEELNKFAASLNEIELLLVKYNLQIDNLLLKLNEEYAVTYEKAILEFSLNIDENDARIKVNELKKKLKEIGEVSYSSIEEYERINKRYTFLTTQKEDLFESRNNLLGIISDMDTIMSKNFKDTFDMINKEFNKVFIKLFGGGEARLILTNPQDILNTGIDIIAIPSGKTLKPISLLSGGERTLTAISLLFSIMNLKKVPFAILDEVESALDETNAEKFGEYLKIYKDKTQILIITHKKKTMEYVDTLYGVTMQESGVSKLVSVKLAEIK